MDKCQHLTRALKDLLFAPQKWIQIGTISAMKGALPCNRARDYFSPYCVSFPVFVIFAETQFNFEFILPNWIKLNENKNWVTRTNENQETFSEGIGAMCFRVITSWAVVFNICSGDSQGHLCTLCYNTANDFQDPFMEDVCCVSCAFNAQCLHKNNKQFFYQILYLTLCIFLNWSGNIDKATLKLNIKPYDLFYTIKKQGLWASESFNFAFNSITFYLK